MKISEDCYEKWMLKIWHEKPVYENHEHMIRTMLDYDYDAVILLKRSI